MGSGGEAVTLKTSLVITGDSSGAVAALNTLSTEIGEVGTSARAASTPVAVLDRAQQGAAASAAAQSRETASLATIAGRLDLILQAVNHNTASAAAGMAAITTAAGQASRAGRDLSTAQDGVARSAGGAAAATQGAAIASEELLAANALAATNARALGAALSEAASVQAGATSVVREAAAANAAATASTELMIGESAQLGATFLALTAAGDQLLGILHQLTSAEGAAAAAAEGQAIATGASTVALVEHAAATAVVRTESAHAGAAIGELVEHAGQGAGGLNAMGGAAGLAAGVLGGVLGIALSAGIELFTEWAGQLVEGDHRAADLAKTLSIAAAAADSFGTAQSLLGGVIDLVTGKLKTQNLVLVQTIKLQAQANIIAAQQAQRDGAKALTAIGQRGIGERIAGTLSGTVGDGEGAGGRSGAIRAGIAGDTAIAPLRQTLTEFRDVVNNPKATTEQLDRALKTTIANIDLLASRSQLAGRDVLSVKQAVLALGTSRNDQTANQAVIDAIDGKGLGVLREDPRSTRHGSPRRVSGSAAQPGATGETGGIGDIGRRLAGIAEGFDDTPPALKRVDAALRQIDGIVEDLRKKEPTGFATMIDEAERLKGVVRSGLTQPLRDFVEQQQQSFAIGEAILGGDTARAEALRQIATLERQMGPLTDQQKDAVLATVEGLDAQARQLDILHAKQQVYLDGLGEIRGIVDDATQAFVRGDLGQFIKTPGKLLDAFQSVQGAKLFNDLFDGAFRELQDQITGTNIVQDASAAMAEASAAMGRQADATGATFAELAGAARGASSALALVGRGGAIGTDGIPLDAAGHAINGINGAELPTDAGSPDVVVRGVPKIRRSPTDLFTESLGRVAEKIGEKVGVKDPVKFGKDIGSGAGKALAGAATGALVSGVAGSLGIKLNKTGSQIGGAIGGFIPIPGGAVIGSLLGGIAGSLFGKAKTNGSAGIGVANGQFSADKGTGASAGLARQASGLAGNVAGALQQIADQLGGGIGSTGGVTIGVNNGNYHVNAVGGTIGKKGSGDVNFGDDQEAAVGFAIRQLLAKGAITGLDTAISKALASSTDVNVALKEALKVADLELTIGGIGATIDKAFRDFETTAKERVRIARQYGFDVVAIEQRNAADRVKLGEQLLKQQVGSIQSLLDELQRGSLFEGNFVDKIGALDTAIAKAKVDLAAGTDGAGDTLAGLLQQRLATAKEGYATTSGYADYRTQTVNEAQAAIAAANARIVQAQAAAPASDPALAATNAALDENNDQNAEILAALKRGNDLAGQLIALTSANQDSSFDIGRLASF